MKKSFRILLAAVASAIGLLAACDEQIVYCPGVVKPAIRVQVTDAGTGAYFVSGLSGFVRDGDFLDSLRVSTVEFRGIVSMSAATERPGVYSVVVRKEGYWDWTTNNVRVEEDLCGVLTVTLQARLQKLT